MTIDQFYCNIIYELIIYDYAQSFLEICNVWNLCNPSLPFTIPFMLFIMLQ